MENSKPDWLRAKILAGDSYRKTREIVDTHSLHTVCESARCPNMGECWSRGTATMMILGEVCTRSCSFCAIQTGRPSELDLGEPARVAESIARMNLKYVVITSVARDDLKDGGASVWAATVRAIHNRIPECAVEVLPADFRGKQEHLDVLLDASPDILNHNMETVKRLQKPTPLVGMRAVYTGTKQASHSHITPLLRSSNKAVMGQHEFINKDKDFKYSTLYSYSQILIE